MLQNFKKRAVNKLMDEHAKISYSQCGEDLILDFVFGQLKLRTIRYLDIGAHHPTYINNTALFYNKGSNGVCIEPDPFLFEAFKKFRKNDVCLNVGIGAEDSKAADFFIMSERTLNTFSKQEAERYVSYGNLKIDEVISIPLISINDVIEKYLNGRAPDFISLDVEGYDINIIQSFDFNRFTPKVWCIETITYTEDKSEKKVGEIIELMLSKGYFVYADTYINTIFVDKDVWKNR